MLPAAGLPRVRAIRFLIAVALAEILIRSAGAQEAPPRVSDDSLHISGVFNSDLPRTEHKSNLKLVVHPHFGDFIQRDALRIPITFIYGVTDRWEISDETDTYFAHGLGKRSFLSQEGFSALSVATKYHIGDRLWRGWDIGVGAGYVLPVGHPPPDITDGLKHLTSFITFAHQLERRPAMRIFWGVGSDLVTQTSIPADHTKNQLRDNTQNLTVGAVWQRGKFNYTLETTYATTRLTGHTHRDLFDVRPGVVWELPKKLTFHAKGQWLFGVSLDASHGPDGTSLGASGKLRINFDFKKWRQSQKTASPP